MTINGHTKITGIFGDPVAHTLSPAMQNAAFRAVGLNAVYVPFHVQADDAGALKAAVEGVRAMQFLGVNVTIPHKERVLRYLDEIDPHASEMGAVNTIVNRQGRLVGYNTDGAGYLLSLRDETGFRPARKKIVIIGAGGASRSIFYAMLGMKPASVVLVNRTIKRASAMAKAFENRFSSVDIRIAALQRGVLIDVLSNADLVVNTTSIGMTGKGELDIPVEALPPKAIVSDIVYRPLKTGFLKAAEKRRLKTHGGIGMLVRQGAIGFELWTGKKAPVSAMAEAALKALKAR